MQAKVISFTDLAGHERYLRTTVFGMLSSEPNYCLLMVAANNGLVGMSKYVHQWIFGPSNNTNI